MPAIHVPGASGVASRDTVEVAQVRSADGLFALAVPTGTYTLTATALGAFQVSASNGVHVAGNRDEIVIITLGSCIH